ncbi:RNA polymerase sigma factor [Sphingomonas sp. PB4P5]|uniref:RNA polymerase sigma factor n=1 Tax=Parasphingomonas puruogangriensis TaxID=3096155 RepID=UPI002FCB8270
MTKGIDVAKCGLNTISDPQGGVASWQVTPQLDYATQEKCRDSLFPVSIFSKIAEGDQKAFQNLYQENCGLVYTIALRILRDGSLAEDAVQEAFVKIWRSAGQFDATLGAPQSWISVIARNVALDLIRKRRPHEELSDTDMTAIAADPCEPSDPKLGKCLAQLPEEQITAIVTMYTYGMSHSELSIHLGAPVGTIKSRVRRATASLKKYMNV